MTTREGYDKNSEGRKNSLANLRPLKKGQIIFRPGRPKGRNGTGKDIWKWVCRLSAPEKLVEPMRTLFNLPRGTVTVESAVIMRLALEAIRGNARAIELWAERTYGKTTQPLDVTAATGPLVVLNMPQSDKGKIIDVDVGEAPTAPAPKTQETQE